MHTLLSPIISRLRVTSLAGLHSHIHGLGLDEGSLQPLPGQGMIGQAAARKAAAMIVSMAKKGKISGKGVLIAGKPGTGKTALAIGRFCGRGKEEGMCVYLYFHCLHYLH